MPRSLPAPLRYVDSLDDEKGPIHKLVKPWTVALPLHAEFGTEPKVY
jgi:nitrate reductase beta subunit